MRTPPSALLGLLLLPYHPCDTDMRRAGRRWSSPPAQLLTQKVAGCQLLLCSGRNTRLQFLALFKIPCPFPLQARELEISIYWHDWRGLCAVKYLRLDDFLDNEHHSMCLSLEPQGMLFAEVKGVCAGSAFSAGCIAPYSGAFFECGFVAGEIKSCCSCIRLHALGSPHMLTYTCTTLLCRSSTPDAQPS